MRKRPVLLPKDAAPSRRELAPVEVDILVLKAAEAWKGALHWHRNWLAAPTDAAKKDARERLEYWHSRYQSLVEAVERSDGYVFTKENEND